MSSTTFSLLKTLSNSRGVIGASPATRAFVPFGSAANITRQLSPERIDEEPRTMSVDEKVEIKEGDDHVKVLCLTK